MYKHIYQRVLVLLLSFTIALVAAEVLLRFFIIDKLEYHVWEPNLHHTFWPDSNIFSGISGAGKFTINSRGMRGAEWDNKKINYITLGGSTTECLYLDDTETWQAHLSKLTGFGVYSMGKSGCTLRENYIHLKYAVSQYKPLKGVILMAGLNDMFKRLSHDTLFNHNFRFTPQLEDTFVRQIFLPIKRTDERVWWRRSAIFQLLRNSYHRHKQIPWTSVQDDEGKNYVQWRLKRQQAAELDTLPDLTNALKEFTILLEATYAQCKHQNLELVLLTQATIYKDTMPDFENNMLWMGGRGDFMNTQTSEYYSPRALRQANEMYNEVLKKFCAQHPDVQLIDIAAQLPKDTSVFYDDCHFNESGARKVAEIIARELN